jgi:hypothetical protein
MTISNCFKAQNQSSAVVSSVPINTEVLGSNRGLAFQMIIDKKIKSVPKLGFFQCYFFGRRMG